MSTETSKSEVQADLESVMAAAVAGHPVDPAVAARVHARADEIRKRLPQTNIAVELIREARDQ
jgi:hypothetical protein